MTSAGMSASIAADRARANADARLVALARESRGEALELIYSAYKSRIYSFLLRLLSDPVGADDLTQDVFTKAYQALGSLTTEHRVLPWLYRIATNTAIDHLRRKRRFTWLRVGRLAGTGEDPLMPDLHGTIPERDQVRRILATLRARQHLTECASCSAEYALSVRLDEELRQPPVLTCNEVLEVLSAGLDRETGEGEHAAAQRH